MSSELRLLSVPHCTIVCGIFERLLVVISTNGKTGANVFLADPSGGYRKDQKGPADALLC